MLLIYGGRFGKAVAERLTTNARSTIAIELSSFLVDPSKLPDVSFAAVVVARSLHDDLEEIDQAFWRARRRWLLCELTDLSLVVGPHVFPGSTACARCASARRISSLGGRPVIDEWQAYANAFRRDRAVENIGFSYALVDIAAELILATSEGAGLREGAIREISIVDLEIQEGVIAGLHRCARCRDNTFAHPTDRFVAELEVLVRSIP